jgi:hypothetical protein
MLRCLVVLALACSALAAAAIAAPELDPPQRVVPCAEVIDHPSFPYRGSSRAAYRYRLVLDSVSVPPAYLAQVSPTESRPWTHFAKHGLVVRSGAKAVTISVPRGWRQRLGIVWGNGGLGVFHTIRLAACPSSPIRGNAYAGGFYLRRPSACVPLVFSVGGRSRTVWFGVGERCPTR